MTRRTAVRKGHSCGWGYGGVKKAGGVVVSQRVLFYDIFDRLKRLLLFISQYLIRRMMVQAMGWDWIAIAVAKAVIKDGSISLTYPTFPLPMPPCANSYLASTLFNPQTPNPALIFHLPPSTFQLTSLALAQSPPSHTLHTNQKLDHGSH